MKYCDYKRAVFVNKIVIKVFPNKGLLKVSTIKVTNKSHELFVRVIRDTLLLLLRYACSVNLLRNMSHLFLDRN